MKPVKELFFFRTYAHPEAVLIPLLPDASFCTSNIKDLGGNIIVDEEDET